MPHKQPQRSPSNDGSSCCDEPCVPCSYGAWYGKGCTWDSYPSSIKDAVQALVIDFGSIDSMESQIVSVPYSETVTLPSQVSWFGVGIPAGSEDYDLAYTINDLKLRLQRVLNPSNPCLWQIAVQISMRVAAPASFANPWGTNWTTENPSQLLPFQNDPSNFLGQPGPLLVLPNCESSGSVRSRAISVPWTVNRPPSANYLATQGTLSTRAGTPGFYFNSPIRLVAGYAISGAGETTVEPRFLLQQSSAFGLCAFEEGGGES